MQNFNEGLGSRLQGSSTRATGGSKGSKKPQFVSSSASSLNKATARKVGIENYIKRDSGIATRIQFLDLQDPALKTPSSFTGEKGFRPAWQTGCHDSQYRGVGVWGLGFRVWGSARGESYLDFQASTRLHASSPTAQHSKPFRAPSQIPNRGARPPSQIP